MKKFLLFLLVLTNIDHSFSQSNNKNVKRGNVYYNLGEYEQAIKYYYIGMKSEDVEVLSKIANSYRFLHDYKNAEYFYRQLKAKSPVVDSNTFFYAEVLRSTGQYDKAKKQYLLLSSSLSSRFKDGIFIQSCDSALQWMKERPLYTIRNLQELNTEYSETAPVVFENGIVFSANREGTIIRKKTGFSEVPFFDLYYAKEKQDGTFSLVSNFSFVINTIHHEGAASFTEDFKRIFFTRVVDDQSKDGDEINRPKLYRSEKKASTPWSAPARFIFNDSSFSFAHPFIEKNEKMLFFSSNMKGGYGGMDIYVCFNFDGKWTDPMNLGPVINTPGDELYPFYHEEGTFYFASNYHIGMGGFDVFTATQKNGDWVSVVNMKPPLNSWADDFALFFNENKTRGFFSSNRSGGKGREDLYEVILK